MSTKKISMSSDTKINAGLREQIITKPGLILDDKDIMAALIAANEKLIGDNIIDFRAIAMDRLEDRFDKLEEIHKTVIATAYENLTGANQIQRAILRMMDGLDLSTFLNDLEGDVKDILNIDHLRVVLESANGDPFTFVNLPSKNEIFVFAKKGFVKNYLSKGRDTTVPSVILREISKEKTHLYDKIPDYIRSEAAISLDFGPNNLPGLLILGAKDPKHFSPRQGTDLLTFFAGVFERIMRRWLR